MGTEKNNDANLLLRPAGPGDVAAMAAITAEVFESASIDAKIEGLLGRGGPAGWAELKAQGIARDVREHPNACFVAELDGRVVGFVTSTIDRAASRGRIVDLAVAAGSQHLGVGRKLLLRTLDRFRELGLKHAKIETLATNEAGQHLYPSVGFREVARQIHYVLSLEQGDGRSKVEDRRE